MDINQLKNSFDPKTHQAIDQSISDGLTTDEIYDFYLKNKVPTVYDSDINLIVSTYGDKHKPYIYQSIKDGFSPSEYLGTLERHKRKPIASLSDPLSILEQNIPQAASPTAKPTTGALPTPEPATGGPLTTTPQPKIQPAVKSLPPGFDTLPTEAPKAIFPTSAQRTEYPSGPRPEMAPEEWEKVKGQSKAIIDVTKDFGKVGLAATSGAALIASIPVSLPVATTGLLSAMVGAALYSGSKPAEGIKGAIKNLADEEKLWILFTGAATGVGRALKPFWEAGKGIARAKWADYAFKQAAREVGLDKAAQSMVVGDTAKAAEIVNAAAEKISQGAGVPFETQKQMLWKTVLKARDQLEAGQKIDWVELNSQFMNTSEDAAKVAEQTIRAARDAKWKEIQTKDAFEREAPIEVAPPPAAPPTAPLPTPTVATIAPVIQPPSPKQPWEMRNVFYHDSMAEISIKKSNPEAYGIASKIASEYNTQVFLTDTLPKNKLGRWSPEDNAILLNAKSIKNNAERNGISIEDVYRKTVTHELVHASQQEANRIIPGVKIGRNDLATLEQEARAKAFSPEVLAEYPGLGKATPTPPPTMTTQATARPIPKKKVPTDKPLLDYLLGRGGINPDIIRKEGWGGEGKGLRGLNVRGLLRKSSSSGMDDTTRAMIEDGFLQEGANMSDAWNLIQQDYAMRSAKGGKRIFSNFKQYAEKELESDEQAYYKYLEDQYANMSEVEKAAVDNYREIQPEMQRIDEEGAVGLGGEPSVKVSREVEVPMGDALHSENPRIEKILSSTKPKEQETLYQYLTKPIKTVWDEIFVPFSNLKEYPEVANLLQLAYDWPKQIGTKGVDLIMGYVGPLKPPGLMAATFRNKLSKNEYLAFERLVDLRSMRDDAKQGILTAMVSPEAQKGYANIPKSAPAYKDLEGVAARSALSDIESEIASIESVLKQVSRDYKKITGGPVEKVSSFDIVNSALERRDALWRAYGRDMVKRGLIRPEDLKEHYAANIILKHISLLDDFGIRLPQRLRRSFRGYTMKRKGTTAPHETNVVVRDFDTISKIELHNRLDDLAAHIKTSYDGTPYFTREEMIEKFGQRLIDLEKYSAIPENLRADWKIIKGGDGKMYAETYNNPKPNDHKVIEIRGQKWKAISMNPGRSYYNAQSITEKRVEEMWNQLLADEDAVLPTQEVLSYLKPIKAVGGPREVVILPEAVADAVLKMRASTFPSKLSRYVFKGTSVWKRVTLDLAGIPFQVNNFVGDMINLAREDPMAFTRIGGAIRSAYEANPFGPQILFKHNPESLSPELKTALTVAEQQSVIKSSALFSSDVYKATFDPRLYKYRGLAGAFSRWNPINWIEGFSEFRESVPRMTYIIKQMERATDPKFQAWRDARIKKGFPLLETKTVDVTGLDEIAGIGKAAREIFVDYGKITPLMARSGRVLFPFSTFYIANAGNWAKYAASHPLGTLAKIGTPYVLMNTWNWTYFPEQERNISKLWRYIPHVWTPYKAKDGRQICIALQTPVDMAFRLIPGLSSALDMIPRYFKTKDKDDIELLWRETWTAAGMPLETINNLLNPAVKTTMDLIANKDYFGNKIYPDAEKGSWSAKQKQATYFLTGMVSPFMQYSRAEEVKSTFPMMEKRFSGTSQPPGWRRELVQNIPKAAQYGPLNISRAAGIRPINTEGAELQRIKLSETLVDQEAYEKANKMHQQALDTIEVKFDTLSATEEQAVEEYSKAAMEQGLKLSGDYRAVQADPDMSTMEKDRASRVFKLAADKYKNLVQGGDRISRIKIMADIINRQIISETDPSRLAKLQAKLMKYENEGSDLFVLSRKNKLSPKAQEDVENHFNKQETTAPRSPLY